ncbi:exodeoxyribonuclease V subunit gamma [Pasteurellaceae bacterium LIM206]|nr:exodeoxyribonuclease V subunit gamma [Pasteurellaceae bacterium LIM206]
MFTVYHSNQLDVQKDILLALMQREPLSDPFQSEVILVQSPGMAQWLQLEIADKKGIAANLKFPMPASFIWQQYADIFADVEQESAFAKEALTWRLMRLIPAFLSQPEFQPLAHYLTHSAQSAQQKLYQLARKVADLFDQYIIYRPQWIEAWEHNDQQLIERQMQKENLMANPELFSQLQRHITWQGRLWRALTEEIGRQQGGELFHRANLHKRYLAYLAQPDVSPRLPSRIFIFGISALPKVYLDTFKAMSRHCDVHLFFNNPSQEYWADIVDPHFLEKLRVTQRIDYHNRSQTALLGRPVEFRALEDTADNEKLQAGNPLLASFGKLGRDFFYLLENLELDHEITAFVQHHEKTLLSQLQQQILQLAPSSPNSLRLTEHDHSLTIHACHSAMREVEVLHDYLLKLFETTPHLTPKDIVVMVADIDKYTPYIQAVFGQYQANLQHKSTKQPDKRCIPFSISDNKLTESDVLLSAFLSLLNLKESRFSAEEVLALLDIPAIRGCFGIALADLPTIREWVADAGIRFGLEKSVTHEHQVTQNYNAWQAGLERMLLGFAMREENGIWQDSLGFDASHGLQGRLAALLAAFVERLYQWRQCLLQPHTMPDWKNYLFDLIDNFFVSDDVSPEPVLYLKNCILQVSEQLQNIGFNDKLDIEVIAEVMTEKLDEADTSMKFLVGRVSFCTLLPMRSIPFKVVCLLGMSEGEYPRQSTPNSFDLLHYHRQKGDRLRRDDDRYLFLEALLAAEEYCYISYVGQSIVDNSEREPSVLVSQLLDYLAENIEHYQYDNPQDIRDHLIRRHAMNVFSPKNFGLNDKLKNSDFQHRTFAKEWLPLARKERSEIKDFSQPLEDDGEIIRTIELSQLIAFVQNPVKFFFEKRLGVYFNQLDEQILDSENFTLERLDLYTIRDDLARLGENEMTDYFARLKVKGTLPYGQFGKIYEKEVQTEMTRFKTAIADYLDQPKRYKFLYLNVETSQGKINLNGTVNNLYSEFNQRVSWRAGNITDKFKIENWLTYLALLVSDESALPPIFVGKDGKKHSFKTLEHSTALEQLVIYVESYLRGMRQMQIVPTAVMEKYLKAAQENNLNACQKLLEQLAYGDEYAHIYPDIYWQRLYQQTRQFDFDRINKTMMDWFGRLIDSLLELE